MSRFVIEQIFDGSLLLAVPIAFAAGVVSFLSPCVLPLLPGYLSYIAGASATRVKVLWGALLFIGGFTALFVSYGALFGTLGNTLTRNSENFVRILGLFTIALGFIFIFSERFYRSFTLTSRVLSPKVQGLVAAPLLGLLFGFGWTPCVGPTLASVQALAFQEASALRGAILSVFYSLGLGLPLLFFALFLVKVRSVHRFLLRHSRTFAAIGGIFLIVLGLAQVTGLWGEWVASLQGAISGFVPVI